MDYLIFNNKKLLFKDILKLENKGITDQEATSIDFCKEWLAKQNSFTLYTSGSTGIPKSIVISREQMIKSAEMTARAIGLNANDKALICLNTNYIGGKMMMVRSFIVGMEMTIVNPTSNPLCTFPISTHFDFIAMVPLQLATILNETPEKVAILNKMKAILLGGAPVNYSLEKKVQSLKVPVYATYGMTETVSHIALRRLNGAKASDCFEALEGVELSLDPRGCLVVKAKVTKQVPVVTNDLVELFPGNKFKWIGRIDNVINSGGIKIQVEQIEQKIQKIFTSENLSRNFFITGLPDEKLGSAVTLIIEGESLKKEDENKFKTLLTQNLGKFEVPKKIKYVLNFVSTPSGKLNRKETLALVS